MALHDAAVDGRTPGEGAHLRFACDDVAATTAALRGRGAVAAEAEDRPWGMFATVEGPDGHRVQFHRK